LLNLLLEKYVLFILKYFIMHLQKYFWLKSTQNLKPYMELYSLLFNIRLKIRNSARAECRVFLTFFKNFLDVSASLHYTRPKKSSALREPPSSFARLAPRSPFSVLIRETLKTFTEHRRRQNRFCPDSSLRIVHGRMRSGSRAVVRKTIRAANCCQPGISKH